ncbi:hypothetical protein BDK51DRAFT_28240 [Blyttiomyces helicus]|uniref:Uncharacterized protein n=1 Tax=Blyttiomyces helicus TaxID=388810 RepID=A0A4P9WDN9_9FUNG|nr:hypothetical protein BDK51DRAFT_28240 [Blyttiomyces helicus]|eukprot:RKO90674.1 hypothetical protein BDK51DRAFT_28240 [Blyttiomyces helicus]
MCMSDAHLQGSSLAVVIGRAVGAVAVTVERHWQMLSYPYSLWGRGRWEMAVTEGSFLLRREAKTDEEGGGRVKRSNGGGAKAESGWQVGSWAHHSVETTRGSRRRGYGRGAE